MIVTFWPIEKIIPFARNARKIPPEAVNQVTASIKEFGWRQPIVVDHDGVMICGHTRLLAARKNETSNPGSDEGRTQLPAYAPQHSTVRRVWRDAARVTHADPGCGAVLRNMLPALWTAEAAKEFRGVAMEVRRVSHEPLVSTHDLRPSERRFVNAMQALGYGRFESLRIQRGELVFDPWPTTVRSVKFGTTTPNRPDEVSGEFELKQETAQLFQFVRSIKAGEIRVLEVRGGLPLAMEVANDGIPCLAVSLWAKTRPNGYHERRASVRQASAKRTLRKILHNNLTHSKSEACFSCKLKCGRSIS
jgi:ParB-like nuclease domain